MDPEILYCTPRYRLDYDSFNVLLDMLRDDLELDGKARLQAMRGNYGKVIEPQGLILQ